MTTWNPDLLQRIAESDDLHVSPLRADGVTHGTPTWIWSVVVSGGLYVRPWNGTNSRWYRSAMTQHGGRITAAGQTIDVTFESTDPEINDVIDAAYRAKYTGSPYLPPMVSTGPRGATVRILPAPTTR